MNTNRILLAVTLALTAGTAFAQPIPKTVTSALKKTFPDMEMASIKKSVVPGMWEYSASGHIGQISENGKYLIVGDVIDVNSRRNLTADGRAKSRGITLASVPLNTMIRFGPKTPPKYIVYAFTDVDCGYCRKLHSHIQEYTRMGIEIRYLAYPRAGVDSPSGQMMNSIWCSKNPAAALTAAKAEKPIAKATCASPIASQKALGEKIGVNGTPALFTTKGIEVGGYLEPTALLAALKATL